MDQTHPNHADPVEDPRYPGITAADDDQAQPPPDWDSHPELAGTQRSPVRPAPEPDDAWVRLRALDAAAAS